MAIQWADNFQSYGTGSTGRDRMSDGLYTITSDTSIGVSTIEDPDPLETEQVLVLFTGSDSTAPFGATNLRKVLDTEGVTIGAAFRMWLNALPTEDSQYSGVRFSDSLNRAQVSVGIKPSGQLEVTRGDFAPTLNSSGGGTVLGTTGAGVIAPNSWNHIEVKTTIDNTIGVVEVYVNGVQVLDLTGVDTSPAGTDADIYNVALVSGTTLSPSSAAYFKDFVIWDSVGSVNNDVLGTVIVVTLRPDADVTLTWTPSTGTTGFDLIDEVTPDDADYVSAGDPPPAPSVFGMSNLPPDITSVRALLPFTRSRKVDGGDGNLQVGLTGTLTDLGTDKPLTTAFTYRYDVSELSPDTGALWTPAEVDNVKLQIDRTI